MSKTRPRFLSLQAVKAKVEQLEVRCERMPQLYTCSTADIVAVNKSLITLCSSLSLVFIQHNLLLDAWVLLRKAVIADARIYSSGDKDSRMWFGRLHSFNNLAYLFQR